LHGTAAIGHQHDVRVAHRRGHVPLDLLDDLDPAVDGLEIGGRQIAGCEAVSALVRREVIVGETKRQADSIRSGGVKEQAMLGGHLIVKEPQYSSHATVIQLVQRALTVAFGSGWSVRAQMPVALDDESEPEPDVCVVPGDPRNFRDAHPAQPVLIVEVALARVRFDREDKGSLYARAQIADYWIVNIPARRLEIYREPVPDAAAVGDLCLRAKREALVYVQYLERLGRAATLLDS
jgi:hypothetical protein